MTRLFCRRIWAFCSRWHDPFHRRGHRLRSGTCAFRSTPITRPEPSALLMARRKRKHLCRRTSSPFVSIDGCECLACLPPHLLVCASSKLSDFVLCVPPLPRMAPCLQETRKGAGNCQSPRGIGKGMRVPWHRPAGPAPGPVASKGRSIGDQVRVLTARHRGRDRQPVHVLYTRVD